MLPAFRHKISENRWKNISGDFAYSAYFFCILAPATIISASICIDAIDNKYKKNLLK